MDGFWSTIDKITTTVSDVATNVGARALEIWEQDRANDREVDMLRAQAELTRQQNQENSLLSSVNNTASAVLPEGMTVQKAGLILGAAALGVYVIKRL